MQKQAILYVVVAMIISIGIALSNGIYEFNSEGSYILVNKFTGTVQACRLGTGCIPFDEYGN